MQRRQLQCGVLACLVLGGCSPLSTTVATSLSNQPSGERSGAQTRVAAPGRVESAADTEVAAGLIGNGGGNLVSKNGGRPIDASMPAAGSMPASPPRETSIEAVQAQAGALKAGSVDDNADFEGYLRYRDEFRQRLSQSFRGQKPREAAVEGRRTIKVVDADGKAIANAEVTVAPSAPSLQSRIILTSSEPITRLRTYADGRASYHADTQAQIASYQVTVKRGAAETSKTFDSKDKDWVITLQDVPQKLDSIQLDLAIVLDTTGSMGGEINKFQATMGAIATRIQELPQKPGVRYGLVAYRDQDDDYVTKHKDFTGDLPSFREALNQLEASGGGDKPEDLEAGLSVVLNKLQWNENENALRLAVLVADAVPHTDYPQAVPYTMSMRQAAEKGIKLFPIGASGLEAEGEYVMRQLAQWTMGQYMFVTRGGDSKSGGGSVSATVDQYREGRLDDIVVNLVQKELNKFGK